MKNLFLSFLFIVFATVISYAQTTAKIKVAGNCGMCKKNIETAAKSAGASAASWDKAAKILTVSFDATSSANKIEEAVAAAGYDTEHQTASQEAYSKLDECCQYERVAKKSDMKEMACCKDGACSKKDMNCCKKGAECMQAKTAKAAKKAMGCCKDASCCKKA